MSRRPAWIRPVWRGCAGCGGGGRRGDGACRSRVPGRPVRTVLFSSPALAEVEPVADRLVIINRGRIVRQGRTAELIATEQGVLVRTADRALFGEIARREGWQIQGDGDGRLIVHGTDPGEVGRVAAREGVALTELSTAATRRLEDLFLELTRAEA